jgi:hypothetical protein
MVHRTSEYYTQFSSSITAGALKKWKQDVTLAESRRLVDPRAMDIIGVQEDNINADPARSGSDPNRLIGAGPQWLKLALAIEETQYVFESESFTI